MDKNNVASNRQRFSRDLDFTFKSLGKSKHDRLTEKRIFPNPAPGLSSQVKLAYETEFENGVRSEFFAWNVKNSNVALLVEYRVD